MQFVHFIFKCLRVRFIYTVPILKIRFVVDKGRTTMLAKGILFLVFNRKLKISLKELLLNLRSSETRYQLLRLAFSSAEDQILPLLLLLESNQGRFSHMCSKRCSYRSPLVYFVNISIILIIKPTKEAS